jgi:hypothetical protein
MQESDEGQEKRARKDILLVGQQRLGPPPDSVKAQLDGITDLERLERLLHQAVAAATSWKEMLDAP